MFDSIARTQFGELHVELANVQGLNRCQVLIGDTDAGNLFDVQVTDSDGVYGDIIPASQINISFNGSDGRRNDDFAAALRFLADQIEQSTPSGGYIRLVGDETEADIF